MIVYCVWAGDQYYPTGPRDLKGIFVDKNEAKKLINKLKQETWDWVEFTKETVRLEMEDYEDE